VLSRLSRIFGKKKQPLESLPEAFQGQQNDLSEKSSTNTETETQAGLKPPQITAVCAQSTGRQRDRNEDALFTLTTNILHDTRHVPFGLYIVADGMGGHENGEVASALAVRAMVNHMIRKAYLPLISLFPSSPQESIQEIMAEGFQEAQRVILKQAPGGGTTVTAALILGEQVTLAHIGDSRAYAINIDGEIYPLTTDHSLVKKLEELGQITADEAALHPQRNVLYRALGQAEPVEPDIVTTHLKNQAFLLLCSDGLWGVVNEKDIAHLVISNESLDDACQQMVDAANEAGGPDNITAVLIRLP
jgi:PPM family protein phosphatase